MDNRRPPSYAAPPPIDHARPPPPPFSQQPPPAAYSQAPPQHPPYAGGPPPGPGPSLPPIQQPYAPQATAPDQRSLPSFNHPPPPQHAHDPREPPDYHQYNQHSRSGHATPAPVNRSYSTDSSHQQRTPTTPAQPGQYPPAQAQDGAPLQPPPPPSMEHGGHHGYPPTNGVPHGLPPPQGHPQQQHDPYQHHGMTPVMENHHGYGPPPQGQGSMYAPSYGPAIAGPYVAARKKQMRATQACEQCRQRKQKCDEGNPCSFCKENSLSCNYRDTPPAKTDKNMERVLGYLEANASGLQSLTSKIDDFDARLRRMEQIGVNATAGAQNLPSYPDLEERQPVRRKPEMEDHRTAPHKLILLWPSVRPLLHEASVDVNDGYVMEAEDRGVLRLYGRGEGIDEHDGTQPGGPASPARSEESLESNAPTPPEGIWGQGFAGHPHGDPGRSQPYSAGGLKPDGSLDLDQKTINELYESYMMNMHIMHPFLDKQRVRKLFDTFINRYSPSARHRLQQTTGFAVGGNSESDRPLKRQRSNGSTGTSAIGSDRIRPTTTERSPGNAIVYLVLALGKICAHRTPLPAVVPDGKLNANQVLAHQITGNPGFTGSSPISATIKPSPMSPKSTPTTQPTPPSEAGIRLEGPGRSRRSSMDGSSPTVGPKNMDVIPGIAYYAKAAEILGDQGDGNDLVHAQMFLLAGLYKGQLARVKESMSWIVCAGRAIQILLDRYKLFNDNYWTAYGDVRRQHEKGQSLIKDKRHNLIVLASWTCLQLESDILAELRLPSSGIQSIENLLLMPHNMPDDETYGALQPPDGEQNPYDNYNNILMFYTAQMFMRKRLNQVHREMYGPDCLNQPLKEVQEMLKGHESILGFWREGLPDVLRWNDSDPPPRDILSARLRAKYWGARYVINRPFLDYALHIMPHVSEGRSVDDVALDVHGNPRDKAEIHLFKAIQGMGETEIWQASQRCIDAAMQSTVALDGVPDRLVVTNIHGTAHAQFGNMLVLSAAFHNKYLNRLIPTDRFHRLLERTIQFLRRLSPISPTCHNDCAILEKINRLLFGVPSDAKHVYRNEVEPTSASNSFST